MQSCTHSSGQAALPTVSPTVSDHLARDPASEARPHWRRWVSYGDEWSTARARPLHSAVNWLLARILTADSDDNLQKCVAQPQFVSIGRGRPPVAAGTPSR